MPTDPSVPSSRGVSTRIVARSIAWRMFGNLKLTQSFVLPATYSSRRAKPAPMSIPPSSWPSTFRGWMTRPGHLDREDLDLERGTLAGQRVEGCGLQRRAPADIAGWPAGRDERGAGARALLLHRRAELPRRVDRGAADHVGHAASRRRARGGGIGSAPGAEPDFRERQLQDRRDQLAQHGVVALARVGGGDVDRHAIVRIELDGGHRLVAGHGDAEGGGSQPDTAPDAVAGTRGGCPPSLLVPRPERVAQAG